MTDRELLEALYHDMQEMKGDVKEVKEDVQVLKEDVQVLKEDVQVLKEDVQVLKEDVQVLEEEVQSLKDRMQVVEDKLELVNEKVTSIEVALENETNHNIQLLAENHMNLVDKLNDAIRVQDKSILYEVQVSGLKARVDILEREMAEMKSKIA
ncbi:MAG: hypothetical protein IJ567_06140 [Lachnospiraceae bacterium]|nr:hypothetical protein [Lachnospiraceae bacterium]